MTNNILINEEYLKKFSPIPLNFNIDEIENFVKLSEQIWIEPVLGEDLYEEILEQVEEDNLTDENATLLLEAVWPLEGFAVVFESLPWLYAQVSEVGIQKGKSDNSDSVDLKDLNYLQNTLRSQVEVRKDFLINYLNNHVDSFPLFSGSDCCTCACKPKLNMPNPLLQVYRPRRKCSDLI